MNTSERLAGFIKKAIELINFAGLPWPSRYAWPHCGHCGKVFPTIGLVMRHTKTCPQLIPAQERTLADSMLDFVRSRSGTDLHLPAEKLPLVTDRELTHVCLPKPGCAALCQRYITQADTSLPAMPDYAHDSAHALPYGRCQYSYETRHECPEYDVWGCLWNNLPRPDELAAEQDRKEFLEWLEQQQPESAFDPRLQAIMHAKMAQAWAASRRLMRQKDNPPKPT